MKVSPIKRLTRFGKRGKLSPRFVGPFEVIEKINPVAYRLELPEEMSRVHNVFHVSQMKPWVEEEGTDRVPLVPAREADISEDLTYEAKPIRIVDKQMRKLRSKMIPQVRIQWDDQAGKQDSWENEDEMRKAYPYLFED